MKNCVSFLVIIAFSVVLLQQAESLIESNFYREESCSSRQGFCVLEKECPGGVSKEFKGLCPYQKKQGAVCCNTVSQEQVNCYQLHNDCKNQCPESLLLGRKGCPENQVCCVLI